MEILAHRGFWQRPEEQNTEAAFRRALDRGYGIETDIRDLNGLLVVSHDLPITGTMLLDDFLQIYNQYDRTSTLALNIKSDGLQKHLLAAIQKHSIDKYFVFDMSIPDTIPYIKSGMHTYTRRSEYEFSSPLDIDVAGIWFDSFGDNYVECGVVSDWITSERCAALVSPELHSRPKELIWRAWLAGKLNRNERVFLCTDFPDEAAIFFGVKGE